MNPVRFALRHPMSVMVAIAAVALVSLLALANLLPEKVRVAGVEIPLRSILPTRAMPVDIFPNLNLPVIYVAQPYGGMDPAQMEAFLTYYYEYHFLYITGIHHVESKNIQGVALMKLFFHPGTNMAQGMAETVSYVNRARSFMPEGTVPPFIMRFDAGSVPVGYLVFRSDTKSITQIQDEALNRVRPIFASLPGVSAPPPFGGNQRTIVVRADPERLRAYNLSPDEVVIALMAGNRISPSGSVTIGDKAPMVPINSVVTDIKDLEKIPIKSASPTIYLRDVATVTDAADIATGYGLVNGKRSVYILVTKRADASTLSVVEEVKKNIPKMQSVLSDDIRVGFEFDQSPYVERAIAGLRLESLLGAVLTGLMVVLFLRDWRSVIVVVLNIPLALLGGVVALWLTGETINLMTLGGLALAVGILVDESTVAVENIHTQMERAPSIARAVWLGVTETAVPRLLAMLCVNAVFLPSFLMQGAARALFVPLALAIGFSMVTSYVLSSTFVPVMSVWLLRHTRGSHSAPLSLRVRGGGEGRGPAHMASPSPPTPLPASGARGEEESPLARRGGEGQGEGVAPVTQTTKPARVRPSFPEFRALYAALVRVALRLRWLLVAGYVAATILLFVWMSTGHRGVGTEIFPTVDSGQFQLRVRAPDGTPLEHTEALAKDVLDAIGREVGPDNVDITVSLVGTASYNYPINAIHLWTCGPQEAVLRIAMKRGSGVRIEELKRRLRDRLPLLARDKSPAMKDVKLSFEAGDIVSQVMSFGSPTPIEVAVSAKAFPDAKAHAAKILDELAKIGSLTDIQYAQPLDYPTLEVNVDRERAAQSGVTVGDVAGALAPATLSSRFTARNFWRDSKSGIGYQVQVELPAAKMDSAAAIETVPVKQTAGGQVLVRDVATVSEGSMPGEFDRYNMRRLVSLTANIDGEDLGRVAKHLDAALAAAGKPPGDVAVDVRGQIVPMRQMFTGLGVGLVMAVIAILLLLTAYFQSLRLALVVVSTAPAVIGGVALALVVTRTTLNIQSFMGSIMAIGVAVANAILLVTFAERARRDGATARDAAALGAEQRLRPILMTSCAMIAGMFPMALGFGDGGEQTAPLGRAVIGGLAVATFATLVLLPSIFAIVQSRATTRSASLDPDDPASPHFDRKPETATA